MFDLEDIWSDARGVVGVVGGEVGGEAGGEAGGEGPVQLPGVRQGLAGHQHALRLQNINFQLSREKSDHKSSLVTR